MPFGPILAKREILINFGRLLCGIEKLFIMPKKEKKLIYNSQVQDAIKIHGPLGKVIAGVAMQLIGFNKINRIYSQMSEYQGRDFAEKWLQHEEISIDVKESELSYIPKEGPFIILSNHPYGAIDGLAMLSEIGRLRPDLKILTNFILSYIPNLTDSFFPVNPFKDKPGIKSSLKGLKMAKDHLQRGGALGIFPAGEVSSNNNEDGVVKDIPWQLSIVKLVRNSGVPIIPVYFDGQNSALFHLMGKIHPLLRTVRLPHELSNKKKKTVALRIGHPISFSEIEDFTTLQDLGAYLYNRTYALESHLYSHDFSNLNTYGEYVPKPVDPQVLEEEIETRSSDKLFSVGSYDCFFSSYKDIPNIMHEIGVRREESFRNVGEGTGAEIDTDKFDTYYKHLYIWDREKKGIVGAYRLGMCREIIKQYGIDGLYSNSLFRYKAPFIPHLEKTIELGRSFVALSHQKEALPLALLIKGLFYVLLKYPDIKYFIGPVSISSWYPPLYRTFMIYYLKQKHADSKFSGLVDPIEPFEPQAGRVDVGALLKTRMDSIERFDKFLYRMSNGEYRLPTLLKKYLKINCRIVDYNVDPSFNYCVDGLIMLDVADLPKAEIDALSKDFKEEEREAIYKRFDL